MSLKKKMPWGVSVYWGIIMAGFIMVNSIVNLIIPMNTNVPPQNLLEFVVYFVSAIALGFLFGFVICYYEVGIRHNYDVLEIFPTEE